jgi:2,5-dioxopentanoate dehydrogenase
MENSTIDLALQASYQAFLQYKNLPLKRRSELLKSIALEIENTGDTLITTGMQETNLAEARLRGEKARTIFQLNSYAEACERGNWLEASIDTANAERTPPKPDIRKMLVPLGPVVVFGASNFPYAYSTAGGDTASAFAAGCSVIVRAHFAHKKTSVLMANAIAAAIKKCNLPQALFTHITEEGNATGAALVQHPLTKAVGFTGSFNGGKAIWEMAHQRKEPIPVFAEMSSINPVYLLPEKLNEAAEITAKNLATSITLGAGQFCTNPGIIVGVAGGGLEKFKLTLAAEIENITPAKMLHDGIANNYREKRKAILNQPDVVLLAATNSRVTDAHDIPTIATVPAKVFLQNPALKEEVFGSFSLIVCCNNMEELYEVAKNMGGQLTTTLMATAADIKDHEMIVDEIKNHCGRIIFNNVPTGVEVCQAMQHGGPWPATTDSRFGSVGADAIKRFGRPITYQNCPNELLPPELQNNNSLNIWRTINNELTKESI